MDDIIRIIYYFIITLIRFDFSLKFCLILGVIVILPDFGCAYCIHPVYLGFMPLYFNRIFLLIRFDFSL